ncbi:RTA1 like protein [Sporormia fimetaria CBS 119925]|uniref:RTA1 like protein n=1 Tax=Sporormia fimetaria CBS 119925 TaxID=1340428 RepID=A0A6A6VNM3_9PLEO|nr:RTA1 like protein [Sporormia fimetaria CBS 119925]
MADRQPPVRGWVDPNCAILGAALFLLAGIIHAWQLFKYRRWWFSTMLVGIIFEVVGYAFRCLSAKNDPYRVTYFVCQYFFIVVAPVFFAAAIYTVLTALINVTGRQYSPLLSPRIILWIFITCDVVATVVQILGAGLIGKAASNREDTTMPNNILLAGLAFQAASFLLFIVLFVVFMLKAKHVKTKIVSKMFYISFCVAVVLLYIRVIFRLAETSEGLYGKLNTNEVYFGCLEFAPVVLATFILAVWHPGRCIPKAAPVMETYRGGDF